MKKLLIIGSIVAGVVLLARRARRGFDRLDWQQMIERMPDGAPPKWMFQTISAIRKDTDRILELLERRGDERAEGVAPPVADAEPQGRRQVSSVAAGVRDEHGHDLGAAGS